MNDLEPPERPQAEQELSPIEPNGAHGEAFSLAVPLQAEAQVALQQRENQTQMSAVLERLRSRQTDEVPCAFRINLDGRTGKVAIGLDLLLRHLTHHCAGADELNSVLLATLLVLATEDAREHASADLSFDLKRLVRADDLTKRRLVILLVVGGAICGHVLVPSLGHAIRTKGPLQAFLPLLLRLDHIQLQHAPLFFQPALKLAEIPEGFQRCGAAIATLPTLGLRFAVHHFAPAGVAACATVAVLRISVFALRLLFLPLLLLLFIIGSSLRNTTARRRRRAAASRNPSPPLARRPRTPTAFTCTTPRLARPTPFARVFLSAALIGATTM
mmetsp:Transcript_29850/g.81940  ORF Transcript_29850/g.81940 Transcript_29850/m.81940 type:complete len:330 (-) Transcript_29850:274-1263(-)